MNVDTGIITFYILMSIIIVIYISQAAWIFKDCKKRGDQLMWVWIILSMISFPTVLIIYLVITRYVDERKNANIYFNKEASYNCNNCGMVLQEGWSYCPNCSNVVRLPLDKSNKMNTKVKFNNGNYKLTIFIFAIGIILFTTFLVYNLVNLSNSIQRVTIPNTTILTLNETGKYTIFYEYNDDVDFKDVKDININLLDKDTNKKLDISKVSFGSNYSFGGHKGKSIFQFNIDKPGLYELSTPNYYGDKGNITLGIVNEFTSKILITVLGSLGILFGTIVIGFVRIIRSVSKNRIG